MAGLDGVPVYMGGVLNEDVEGHDIPVDVHDDLVALGVIPLAGIDDLVAQLGNLREATLGVES